MSFLISPFRFGVTVPSGLLTVDHTKVGSTDHTDLPVLVKGTFPDLADIAHGGLLTSVNNFAIFTDSGHTTFADFERVVHNLNTGYIEYWYRAASVSHTVDTLHYAQWDPANTTDRSNATGVWVSSVQVRNHFGDGTTLSLTDSTSHARNLTGFNTPTAGAGKIGGGVVFNNTTFAQVAYDGTALTALTVMLWVKPTLMDAQYGFFEWMELGSGSKNSGIPFMLFQANGTQLRLYVNDGYRETSQTLVLNTQYHVAATLGGGTWSFYLNGSLLSTYSGGVAHQSSASRLSIGSGFPSGLPCIIDEFLVASATYSADRILAEANMPTLCTLT